MGYVRRANEEDLAKINEYFEDAGVTFSDEDEIEVFEGAYAVALYLYEDRVEALLDELNNRTVIDEQMTLLENLVDDLREVHQGDDGVYYVMK